MKSIGRPEVETKADFHADYRPLRAAFWAVINEPIPEIKHDPTNFVGKRSCCLFESAESLKIISIALGKKIKCFYLDTIEYSSITINHLSIISITIFLTYSYNCTVY